MRLDGPQRLLTVQDACSWHFRTIRPLTVQQFFPFVGFPNSHRKDSNALPGKMPSTDKGMAKLDI
jgi:hypothetical protein